jgi:hypothetical protein
MGLTYRNGVSIAEIIVYVPSLAVAIFLSVRHGFARSSGWMFIIVFCIARLIGPAMQLAEISNPREQALYEGSAILNNVGFSPLTLAALGLLSRLLDSINKTHHTFVQPRMLRIIELLVLVGLILGIVGGVDAADDYVKSGRYQPGSLNKAGTALMIIAWVLLVIATALTSSSISHAEHGERRLLMAIVLALPFLLVRLIYSIFSTFTHEQSFNLLDGSVTVLLCVALIEEFIVVLIFEGTGLTLKKVVHEEHVEGARIIPSSDSNSNTYAAPQQQRQQKSGAGNKVLKALQYTIIGRIVMAFIPNKEKDVEMQHQQHHIAK